MKQTLKVALVLAGLTISCSALANTSSLATQAGREFGGSFSLYRYTEPGLMSLRGVKLGVDFRATETLQANGFVRGELRFALGTVNYNSNGTGSSSGNPDWYLEGRGLIGADQDSQNAIIAGYTGLGYRFLFNDIRGISTSGAAGYRRKSNYLYFPVGINHRSFFSDQAKLTINLEFDLLLLGKQISQLSDTGLGYADVTNTQNKGYGLKLGLIHEKDGLSIGPYLNYWNIDQSDISLLYQNGTLVGMGVEPKNNTIEVGMKASKYF